MTDEERPGAGPFADGWDVLREGAWSQARERFEEQLAVEETPEALEGLGWAGYCLDDDALTFSARERAYRLYRERGGGPGGGAGSRVARLRLPRVPR